MPTSAHREALLEKIPRCRRKDEPPMTKLTNGSYSSLKERCRVKGVFGWVLAA